MTTSTFALALLLASTALNPATQAPVAQTPTQRPRTRRNTTPPDAWTFAMSVRPDGQRIAAARFAGEIALLDSADGTVLTTLQPRLSAQPWALAYAPDGRRLAALAQDGSLRIWTFPGDGQAAPSAGDAIEVLPPREERLRHRSRFEGALSWAPSGERLLVGDVGGQVRLLSASGEMLSSWKISGRRVGRLHAWSSDGDRFYIADGSAVEVCSAEDGSILRSEGRPGRIDCRGRIDTLAVQPHGDLIATGHLETCLRIWRVSDGKLHFEREYPDEIFVEDTDNVADVSFSPSGDHLAFSTSDGVYVRIIDPADGKLLVNTGHIAAHFGERARLAWSPNNERLWFAFECGTGRLLSVPVEAPNEIVEHDRSAVPFFAGDVGVILDRSGLLAYELDGTRRW